MFSIISDNNKVNFASFVNETYCSEIFIGKITILIKNGLFIIKTKKLLKKL